MIQSSVPAELAIIPDEGNNFPIREIISHKIGPSPAHYKNGPVLLFEVQWDSPQDHPKQKEILPYKRICQTEEGKEYMRKPVFQRTLSTDTYKEIYAKYPHRFPEPAIPAEPVLALPPPPPPVSAWRAHLKRGRSVRV